VVHGTTGAPRDIARSAIPDWQPSDNSGGPPRGLARLTGVVCGRRSKFIVAGIWILIMVAASPFAGKLSGAEKNDASAYLPASAESTQELNAEAAFQAKNLNPAVVVYTRAAGITAADLAKATGDARHFATLSAVQGRVSTPAVSKDHTAIETVIGANLGYNADIGGFINGVKATAAGDPGLTSYVAGPAANAADEVKIFKGIDSTLLYATLAVVVVLLLLTYRSPVLWLLPILSAGVALTAAQAVVYWLTQHANLTVNGQTEGILVVLVIGASTDYALLLIARYREELRRQENRHAAMAIALRRAGPAILASALTVVAGMLCLMAAESNDISGLGPVAAIGIAVGVIAMVTLLPAVLVIFGRWIFWPVRPEFGSTEPTSHGLWSRVGALIARKPRTVWMLTAVLLAAGVAGLAGLRFGTLTVAQSFRGSPSSVTAQSVLARHFPAGAGEPVDIVSTAASGPAVVSALATTPGITAVSHPVIKNGQAFTTGTMAMSPDSPAAYQTVDLVRSSVHKIPDADARVGGGTAIAMDAENAATHDRNLLIPLILGVVLIILSLLLRALVAPLLLIGTVVLSFASALGLSALVFRHAFGFAGADTSVPLFVFVFLVALGIDYNIFLMTRVREESLRAGTRAGALKGLAATGGVITSAGLVLAGTFAMLATLPLVEFTEIGFAVALGVLMDTIIVRSVLVTSLNLDLGRRIWWPSSLSRARAESGIARHAA
jgi:RND superfamily putative drug exporter